MPVRILGTFSYEGYVQDFFIHSIFVSFLGILYSGYYQILFFFKNVIYTQEYNFFFFFLGLHSWHTEIPELGVESELQLQAYTTAMLDPSWFWDLHHSSQQCRIPNPLSKAKDQIEPSFSWILVGLFLLFHNGNTEYNFYLHSTSIYIKNIHTIECKFLYVRFLNIHFLVFSPNCYFEIKKLLHWKLRNVNTNCIYINKTLNK